MTEAKGSAQYQKIRARLDELYGKSFSDRAASLAITHGRSSELIRNIKRGLSKQPTGQDFVNLAAFLKKPGEWLTAVDDGDPAGVDPTSDRAIIGRTAEARNRSGMTMETVSRLLDVTITEYVRFESTVPIYPKLVARFCWITGVSADWLFSGQEYDPERERPTGPSMGM